MKRANELFEQSLVLPDETVEKVAEAYVKAGEMATEGYTKGIEEGAKEAAQASAKMGKSSVDELEMTLEIKSPSRVTKRIGENFDEGFIVGIKERQPEAIDTIANLAGEMLRTAENGLQTKIFIEIGKQIPAGMVQGINSGKSDVINAIKEMCTSAVEAAKNELDINSPSRKFAYMGEMSGEGYIEGWKKSMVNVNEIIAQSLPDTVFPAMDTNTPYGSRTSGWENSYGAKQEEINIVQNMNIYGDVTDPIEMNRKFKQTLKEAAKEW